MALKSTILITILTLATGTAGVLGYGLYRGSNILLIEKEGSGD